MSSETSDRVRVADALANATRAVALTGLYLGWSSPGELDAYREEWRRSASLDALLTRPEEFWGYFAPAAERAASREVRPVHEAIADLERRGYIHTLITQNVDRLHARAGSLDVIEVHGNIFTLKCERCGEQYGLTELDGLRRDPDGVPRCTTEGCGYPLRPAGTLWGEPLIAPAVQRAWEEASEADLFLVLDSDLRTVPISLLPSVPLTRGTPLILIGEEPTQYDRYAEVLIREAAADVMVDVAGILAARSRDPRADPPPGDASE
jgi:NAD-dependent deacetylase